MGSCAGYLPFPKSFATTCHHHSQEPCQWSSKTIVPPIITSTIFQIDNPEKPDKFLYGRLQNPSRNILENVLTAVNAGKVSLCFSSGISALTAVLGLLNQGDHIVACEEMNSENRNVFSCIAKRFGINTTFTDFTNSQCVCSSINDNTKLLWTENPTDPTMKITDICGISEIAKAKNILFGVDNTYLTPYLQRPLELGADIVCQSLTKYINGHSDTLMGSLCLKDMEGYKPLYTTQIMLGMVPSPFDCYQALRGMRTLHLRMESHHEKSLVIANFLEKHKAVEKVLHPGLPSHPQHELFKKQTSGHSGVLSFYIKGGIKEAQKVLNSLNYFAITDVGGGIESTASIPFIMSHKDLTSAKKAKLNICDNLIKLSVGLETVSDLICDLDTALGSIGKC